MTHKELVAIFTEMFPAIKVKQFWKKGPNAIRIRTDRYCFMDDVVFTYFNEETWKLETMQMFEKSVDGI